MTQPNTSGFAPLPKLAKRASDVHKGDFGHVLVVAGSRGMSGAAIMAGSAALRGGAGLVTVAVPESIWPIVAGANPALMTAPLHDHLGRLGEDALRPLMDVVQRADVVVLGPGLGKSDSLAQLVTQFVAVCATPMVIDADGLNGLGVNPIALKGAAGPRILTPHPGEFARLTNRKAEELRSPREQLANDFARDFGVTLVLKGRATFVTDGTEQYRNATGNPGMATAGTGDVLAGLIGALVGQGLAPFAAAQLGVYLHGLAGDLARDALGETSLTAPDVIEYLPRAFMKHAAG
jgi:NAD(P)H-hydrate epimerase